MSTKRFIAQENGTVLDSETGLIWQHEFIRQMSWSGAMEYAKNLRLGGYTDWRLPAIQELITLIDFEKHDPAGSFPEQISKIFWSSSPYSGSSSFAWSAGFNYGYVYYTAKVANYAVRCVRHGPLKYEAAP